MSRSRRLWMMPGPADVDPEVLQARGVVTLPDSGPPWVQRYYDVVSKLASLLKCQGFAAILPGNAHLGLEIAIRNAVPSGCRIVSLVNGHWGARIAEIGRALGYHVTEIGYDTDLGQLQETLSSSRAAAVTLAHGDSASGVLNPLERVAACANQHRVTLIADIVATIGAIPIQVESLGAVIVVANSSKAIGAETGLVLIAASQEAWNRVVATSDGVGYFSDLRAWTARRLNHEDASPTIGSISAAQIQVLDAALDKIEREGTDQRYERHRSAGALMRRGLTSLGFGTVHESVALPTITVASTPGGVCAHTLVRHLRNHDIHIDVGIGIEAGRVIRVGHMGSNACPVAVRLLLESIQNELCEAC